MLGNYHHMKVVLNQYEYEMLLEVMDYYNFETSIDAFLGAIDYLHDGIYAV